MMNFIINKRLEKFIKVCLLGENQDVLSIHLDDIGESFYFDDEAEIQNFLNKQSIERFGGKSLRNGYFDYVDEYQETHRYVINVNKNGEISSYYEKII